MPASDAYDAAEIKKQKNKRNHKKIIQHTRPEEIPPVFLFCKTRKEEEKKERASSTVQAVQAVQAAQLPMTDFAAPETA